MKKRTKITQELCDHVRILLAGGATGEKAAQITGTSTGTVSRIRAAGFDALRYAVNTDRRRIEEKNREMAERLSPETMMKEEKEKEQVPGQISMLLPEKEEKPAEMSEQTKMMRFQAAQVDKLYMMLNRINDNICQLIRMMEK